MQSGGTGTAAGCGWSQAIVALAPSTALARHTSPAADIAIGSETHVQTPLSSRCKNGDAEGHDAGGIRDARTASWAWSAAIVA